MKKSLSLALIAASMVASAPVFASDVTSQNAPHKTSLKTTRSAHCESPENASKKECAQTGSAPSATH